MTLMTKHCLLTLISQVVLCFFVSGRVNAQAAKPTQTAPVPSPKTLPFPAQVKKAVLFIQSDCLKEPTPAELSNMTPDQQAQWKPEAIAKLTPQQLATMPHVSFSGTGFIVSVPAPDLGADQGFLYIITNRHVALPGVEHGKPCKVVNQTFFMNHKDSTTGASVQMRVAQTGIPVPWIFPLDEATDLAAGVFLASPSEWDYTTISLKMFATREMVDQYQIVEGDPVVFAGLFVQYAGTTRLEPVVRSGTIAMLPKDQITTTLQKLGSVYLAEAHAFGGNSGSPMFVDVNRFNATLGFDYKFLGVVSGEIHESDDFSIQTSTSFSGTVAENSGVSMIVPAQEVEKLLMLPLFQKSRADYTAVHKPKI